MPIYEYRGLNRSGKNVKSTVDAENLRAARVKLKKAGIYVTDLKDKSRVKKKDRSTTSVLTASIPVKDKALMTRQLASLMKAGIPLVDTLGAVADQTENPTLSHALREIRDLVNEGSSLNRALARFPKIFDKIYVSMCEAGEMSGTLDVILLRLAEFAEAQNELRSRVRSAMTYPVIVMVATAVILLGIFTFLIPKITGIFENFPNATLPWYTLVVMDISDFVLNYWFLLVLLMGAAFLLFSLWRRSPSGSVQWDQILLSLPVLGPITRMIAVSRFTRTLATLLAGGVPMLTAFGIVRNVVNNEILARAIDQARDNISEGESIAAPLKSSEQFPPIVIHMVSIGEKTGDLENMLTQVSDTYDFQVKNNIDSITSAINPILLIVLGGVIAFIAFAVIVPIMELSSSIG